jgi:hypothetical protein
MIITVLERRGEIGLRRALGATPHIGTQFVAEAMLLAPCRRCRRSAPRRARHHDVCIRPSLADGRADP